MKYMKHLRKLALLSSLALSFKAYADGTLPLPGVNPPMLLEGDVSSLTEAARPTLTLSLVDNVEDAVSAAPAGYTCPTKLAFHKALGLDSSVTFGNSEYTFVGVCLSTTATDTRRVLFATFGNAMLRLDGTATVKAGSLDSFNGNLWQDQGATKISVGTFSVRPK